MFEKLCGPDAFSKVMLVITMGANNASPALQQVEEHRLQELQDRYWASMLKRGSSIEKHDHTVQSAERILQILAKKASPVVLQVQREIVDDKLVYNQTGVGQLANEALIELQEKMGNNINSLTELLHAMRTSDKLMEEEMEKQLETSREKVKDTSIREKLQQAKWEEDQKRILDNTSQQQNEEETELAERLKDAQETLDRLTREQKSLQSNWEKELRSAKGKGIPLQAVEEGHVIVAIAKFFFWMFIASPLVVYLILLLRAIRIG
jgi:predicted RNase H-like nuclease (RuvC/YqgF family)